MDVSQLCSSFGAFAALRSNGSVRTCLVDGPNYSLRVHVPNNWVLRALVIVVIVQVLFIRYLDP